MTGLGAITLFVVTGCAAPPPVAAPAGGAGAAFAVPVIQAQPPPATAPNYAAPAGTATPEQACAGHALAAASVDTGAGQTLTTARAVALSAYASPRAQARLDPVAPDQDPSGKGPGLSDVRPPDPQEQQWRQHHARTTPNVRPDTSGRDDTHPGGDRDGRAERAVLVAGTATGTDGWTAPIAPYRLDCLLTLNAGTGGWLVDDIASTPTAGTAATSPAGPAVPDQAPAAGPGHPGGSPSALPDVSAAGR